MTATRSRKGSQTRHPAASDSGRGSRITDRFVHRRLAEERRRGLRRLGIVLGLTAVCTLAIGVIGFLNSPWFDVDEITVTGNTKADPHLIVAASGIEIGQALLEVDTGGAVGEITLVPWVDTAEVTRNWTGSVQIAVTERGPSAVLNAAGRFALVDDHGRQLEIVDRRPDGYMPVIGIEGSGVAGESAPDAALPVIALLDALPDEVEQQIIAVTLEDDHLYLELAVGGRANFGDGSELGPKLQALETMLATVDLTCLNTIDVRVPSAPTLTRTPAGAAPTGSAETTDAAATAESGAAATSTAGSNEGEEPDYAAVDC